MLWLVTLLATLLVLCWYSAGYSASLLILCWYSASTLLVLCYSAGTLLVCYSAGTLLVLCWLLCNSAGTLLVEDECSGGTLLATLQLYYYSAGTGWVLWLIEESPQPDLS